MTQILCAKLANISVYIVYKPAAIVRSSRAVHQVTFGEQYAGQRLFL